MKRLQFLFSQIITTVTLKFTYIVGTFFTKLRLFFHGLLHYRHTFPPMHKELYAGRVKFFAAASERFT